MMRIAIPLYDRFTALDAVGPYEVLSRLPGATVHFVADEPGMKRTETGMLGLSADLALEELPDPEIVVVPGGYGTRALLDDEQFVGWVRRAHETSEWTTSVCTGSLVLAAHVAGDDVAKAIQLGIEYDPEPPFDSGSPSKAGAEIVELVTKLARAEQAELEGAA